MASTQITNLLKLPRITITAELEPLIGSRIQPTGFPNLGASEFETPSGARCLLVESAQSIANRLEATAWDDAAGGLVEPLKGLPYVETTVDGIPTDSIREAHRLNSAYLNGIWDALRDRAGIPRLATKKSSKKKQSVESEDGDEDGASASVDRRRLAKAVFFYDPSSVLHGVFLEKITGLARLTRIVSGFIEARNVSIVASGGVKNDRVDPSGKAYEALIDGKKKSGASAGFGNVPYARTEYVAEHITASFAIDTTLLRSYGLGNDAERLLVALALWKIRVFLEEGARLRTACDLVVKERSLTFTRPAAEDVPERSALEEQIRSAIEVCAGDGSFASPSITKVAFEQ